MTIRVNNFGAGPDLFFRYVARVRYPSYNYIDQVSKYLAAKQPDNVEQFDAFVQYLLTHPKGAPFLDVLSSKQTEPSPHTKWRIDKNCFEDVLDDVALIGWLREICSPSTRFDSDTISKRLRTLHHHGYITATNLDHFFQLLEQHQIEWHRDEKTYWQIYGVDWILKKLIEAERSGYILRYDAKFREKHLILTPAGVSYLRKQFRRYKPTPLGRAFLTRDFGTNGYSLVQNRHLTKFDYVQTIILKWLENSLWNGTSIDGVITEWTIPKLRPRATCDIALWQSGDVPECPSVIIELESHLPAYNRRLERHPYAICDLSMRYSKPIILHVVSKNHVYDDVMKSLQAAARIAPKTGSVLGRVAKLSDVLNMELENIQYKEVQIGSHE